MPTPLERFFMAAECSTQAELATFLGIRQSSISDAKKRKRVPAAWLLTLWRKRRINPEWILTGQGPRCFLHAGCSENVRSPACETQETWADPRSIEELLLEIVRKGLVKLKESGKI